MRQGVQRQRKKKNGSSPRLGSTGGAIRKKGGQGEAPLSEGGHAGVGRGGDTERGGQREEASWSTSRQKRTELPNTGTFLCEIKTQKGPD